MGISTIVIPVIVWPRVHQAWVVVVYGDIEETDIPADSKYTFPSDIKLDQDHAVSEWVVIV